MAAEGTARSMLVLGRRRCGDNRKHVLGGIKNVKEEVEEEKCGRNHLLGEDDIERSCLPIYHIIALTTK